MSSDRYREKRRLFSEIRARDGPEKPAWIGNVRKFVVECFALFGVRALGRLRQISFYEHTEIACAVLEFRNNAVKPVFLYRGNCINSIAR